MMLSPRERSRVYESQRDMTLLEEVEDLGLLEHVRETISLGVRSEMDHLLTLNVKLVGTLSNPLSQPSWDKCIFLLKATETCRLLRQAGAQITIC